MEQNKNPEKKKKQINNWGKYTSIASQMIVIIVAGTFGGLKLDQWVNIDFPLFTLILTLSSVILAIYLAIKDFLKS